MKQFEQSCSYFHWYTHDNTFAHTCTQKIEIAHTKNCCFFDHKKLLQLCSCVLVETLATDRTKLNSTTLSDADAILFFLVSEISKPRTVSFKPTRSQ